MRMAIRILARLLEGILLAHLIIRNRTLNRSVDMPIGSGMVLSQYL